jgi:2-C-methyl-D-erythritol 4-phosphate cytidylyltransferase
MKKVAVIVAAGSGSRMGKEIPKQFLELAGKPILYHTLDTFLGSFPDMQIVLVIARKFMNWGQEIANAFVDPSRIKIVEGGNTRFQSVRNGLATIHENSVVFVHDGVRCLLTGHLIHRCYEQALLKGSAVPTVATTETVRIVEGDEHRMIDRSHVRMVQTPQTFLSNIIVNAFRVE